MKLVLGIIVAIVIVGLMMAASSMLASEEESEKFNVGQFIAALGIGCLVGVINTFLIRFTGNLAFLAPISLIIMIAVSCYFVYWFAKEGGTIMEIVLFSVMSVAVFFTTQAAAVMTATMLSNAFLVSLVMVLPKAVLVGSIGFYLIDACLFRLKNVNNTDWMRIITLIVVLSVIGALLIVCIPRISWGSIGEKNMPMVAATDVDTQVETEEDADVTVVDYTEMETDVETELRAEGVTSQSVWYVFYNLYLLTDANPLNDFNFGPNPFREGMTAEEFRQEFYTRLLNDPAFAAGALAWLDANVGTRYLGEFYESCKGDWAKTINLTKERFMADQALFYQTVQPAIKFYDTATVKLEYKTDGLDDQMYMNPYTPSGVPDVVVMSTKDHGGYFLTFEFSIKADQVKTVDQPTVSYRIDCGFQPTNVEKVMNIKPDDTPRTSNPGHSTPDPTPKPGGKDPNPEPSDPTPEPSDPTPKPDPTPTPTSTKKPSQDPVNNGNAQKGGGQNKPTNGAGEVQSVDPRIENPTGPQNDNNHGHSDPKTVTPSTPPVVEEHKSEPVVVDSNPQNYVPDPVTDRGPTDPTIQPTSLEGDGEFTPAD